ncbi:uncharacterized protein LOC142340891 isoform X1 [Convolutriloba macropyga]|uniref:uncharacterized protein LOC142340891 isoform X1 n=1 Tax=Convolutriloba macropyga TaxID=536237 RepID=UPI003F5204D0
MAGSMCFNTCVQHTLVERMEIDVNSAYMVSFDARSIGKELSKGYFFIDCFDTNGYSIQSVEVNRKLQFPAVKIIGISEDRKVLSIEEETTDWDDVAQNRLALYLDGDVEKLPLRDGLAARIIVNKSSTEITLQNLLSSSINLIFGITKARLHAHSSSFVYPALSGHLIPSEWTHYESRIEGEAFAINNFKFRPGTVSVRIGFLANHGQKGKEVEMVVKNFTFSLIKYSFN